jgi:chaperonin GroEL
MECVLEDPYVLLHDKRIGTLKDLISLLDEIAREGRAVLIVADEVEGEALAALVVNQVRGTLRALAVKAPGFGDRRKAQLQDIGVLTGATVIAEEAGRTLEKTTLADLGTARRVVADKDNTTLIGGGGSRAVITGRVAQIRAEMDETTSDYDKEKLQERLARLSGGVAVIRVGAPTEAEMKNRKDAFDDAIRAAQAAGEEGVSPGGGVALLRCVGAVEAVAANTDGDARTGARMLARALQAPIRQIAENSGADGGVVADRVLAGEGWFGFDAAKMEYADLASRGIVDATKVLRVGLTNAVSVATTLLLTEATLVDVKDEDDRKSGPSAELG